MLFAIRIEQGFGAPLALVVTSARAVGVHIAPIILGLRMLQWIAIHFTRGRVQDFRPRALRQTEEMLIKKQAYLETKVAAVSYYAL